ncbi:hypothetical protein BTR14_02435 [Rhizobium rhizosphaerae]|uniref:DUF930 domain-containing protein n=1 Tax=Xaviernesmea rhizosphaerae TaxID=1672749 RepID=A0ABX3PIV2_9HYPH|nr:DUF930 domain-containing protein [Xaviernesmea rhizosphaerae]OQP88317.1 hypothetical protein BTR14_02435 [Xaviernesmea rhizosphaerae]
MSETPPAQPVSLFRSSRPRAIAARDARARWPYLLSLLLHLALIPLLLLLVAPDRLPPSGEQGLSVEVVTEPEARPSPAPAPQPPARPSRLDPTADGPQPAADQPAPSEEKARDAGASVPPPSPSEQQPTTQRQTAGAPADLVLAKRLFAAAILKDPRSRKAVKALRALSPDDQIEQLCNIEAMEQIKRHDSRRRPDFIISYALAPPSLQGPLFVADGAAVHDRDQWIGLRYRCVVTPDRRDVVEFAFAIGANIARDEWSSLSLPTEEGASD